jgi:hypothetical protein
MLASMPRNSHELENELRIPQPVPPFLQPETPNCAFSRPSGAITPAAVYRQGGAVLDHLVVAADGRRHTAPPDSRQ